MVLVCARLASPVMMRLVPSFPASSVALAIKVSWYEKASGIAGRQAGMFDSKRASSVSGIGSGQCAYCVSILCVVLPSCVVGRVV